MTIRVQHEYMNYAMLTVPNVRVLIHVADLPQVLFGDGHEDFFGIVIPEEPVLSATERERYESFMSKWLRERNWRKLRERLINLNLLDTLSLCKWLAEAGYIPAAALSQPQFPVLAPLDVAKIADESLGWKPEYVTPKIIASIKKYRDIFAWLMGLDPRTFRRAVEQSIKFDEERRVRNQVLLREVLRRGAVVGLKDPAIEFMHASKAPAGTDPETLRLCLQGTGTALALSAKFWWHSDGKPIVTIDTNSPLSAIGLSIHIDRNFSRRHWIVCATCGKGRDQIRGRDRFCSPRCRHQFNTTKRRERIKLLLEGERAWAKLPESKRRGQERWQWISARAERRGRGKVDVDPLWAKRELSKIKAQKQKKN